MSPALTCIEILRTFGHGQGVYHGSWRQKCGLGTGGEENYLSWRGTKTAWILRVLQKIYPRFCTPCANSVRLGEHTKNKTQAKVKKNEQISSQVNINWTKANQDALSESEIEMHSQINQSWLIRNLINRSICTWMRPEKDWEPYFTRGMVYWYSEWSRMLPAPCHRQRRIITCTLGSWSF